MVKLIISIVQCHTKDHLHISLLILSEFQPIKLLLFPLENLWHFDDYSGNRSYLIYLNSLNIRSEIWTRS